MENKKAYVTFANAKRLTRSIITPSGFLSGEKLYEYIFETNLSGVLNEKEAMDLYKIKLLAEKSDLPSSFKVKDIGNNGEINRDSLEKIPYSVHMKVLKRSILERDDLLFSIAGTIGRVAIVDNDLNNSNVNQALGIIRLNDKLQHLNLVWLSLQSDRTQKNIISKVVQGVQANTSLANLRDIPIIIPSLELLTKWNNVIGDLMVNFRLNQFSSRTLQKTRDTLLPKLLSGELDVSDLDIENEG